MTALLYLLSFFTGLGLSLARHPIYGLITYVGAYYLHPPSRWWGASLPDLRWALLSAGVTVISIIIHRNKLATPGIAPHRKPFMTGFVVLTAWLGIQSLWALEPALHSELLVMYVKYLLLIWIITTTLDTEEHLKWFLWAHVLGCCFMGWTANNEYDGGRFDSFGGSDINESNAGALQLVSGIMVGAALFLDGKIRDKVGALLTVPWMMNGLILTGSRSGFLATMFSGLVLNFTVGKSHRTLVRLFSTLAVVVFLTVSTSQYWERMNSIKATGEEVAGVDTGSGRLDIMKAQLLMAQQYPLGCGHRCTVTLSPQYLDASHLVGEGANTGRASHNTVMSLLVEQGIIGAFLYGVYLLWLIKACLKLRSNTRNIQGFFAILGPALIAFLGAMCVGDQFVDYLRSEIRIWMMSLLVVCLAMTERAKKPERVTELSPRKTALPVMRSVQATIKK